MKFVKTAALVALVALAWVTSPAGASEDPAVDRYYSADYNCRGMMPSPQKEIECAVRDRLFSKLETLGYCFLSEVDDDGAATHRWVRCDDLNDVGEDDHGDAAVERLCYAVVGVRGGDRLNVRSGPSTKSRVVARLRNGDPVAYAWQVRNIGSSTWFLVSYKISEEFPPGWVNSKFLREVDWRLCDSL